MRPRSAAIAAAVLTLALAPSAVSAAGPAVTITQGELTVFSSSCDDYFAILDVSWTGGTANGATQVTGEYTTPGTLDTVTGESAYGWRPPQHDGTASAVFSGPFAPGQLIGAEYTLTIGGKPQTDAGRPIGTAFLAVGTCTPAA